VVLELEKFWWRSLWLKNNVVKGFEVQEKFLPRANPSKSL
jgi:hypothetical protein